MDTTLTMEELYSLFLNHKSLALASTTQLRLEEVMMGFIFEKRERLSAPLNKDECISSVENAGDKHETMDRSNKKWERGVQGKRDWKQGKLRFNSNGK